MQIIGAYATILFNDEETPIQGAYFSFGNIEEEGDSDSFGIPDFNIFYYAEGEEELQALMEKGSADFTIISYELRIRYFRNEENY